MKNVLQKGSLLLTAVLLFVTLGGCGQSKKVQLNVFNWGDYIDPDVVGIFEQETGIDVVYSMYETNEDMYTSIKTSDGPSYDVIFPSDYMIRRMSQEGLLAKLDLSAIPNYALIDDRFTGLAYDPQNEYSVPYMWGTVGIAYNTEMVSDPVDSWGVLWDPAHTKNLFMMDSVRDSLGVALKYLGYSMNTKDQAELDEAYQKLVEQKPLVLAYTGDEVKDKMVAGEAALAVVYSGDYVTIAAENESIAYAIPKEGSNLWFDGMCILASSERQKEAAQFISFMCRTDIAERNRAYICYSSPQKEVMANLPEDAQEDPAQNPPPEVLAQCEVFEDLANTTAYYEELWTKLLGG